MLGLLTLLMGQLGCPPPQEHADPRPPRLPRTCLPLEPGQPVAPLSRLMKNAVNPSLSALTLLLFRDRRSPDDESRCEEIAALADRLSDCFLVARTEYNLDRLDRSEFDTFAAIGSHAAQALSNAAHQRQASSQQHWFLHLKEACSGCHSRYRIVHPPASSPPLVEKEPTQ